VIVFAIYLLTGLLTLLPVLWMMLGAWMGVPIIPTEYVSAIGSCILVVAAFLTLFQRRTAAEFSVAGVLCTLPFWVIEPSKAFLHGGFSPILIALFLSFLLFASLSLRFAIKDLRTTDQSPHSRPRQRNATLAISAICLLVLCGLSYRQEKANERIPSEYIFPDGYVGWAVIHFEFPGVSSTSVADGKLMFDFPESGVLRTSSKEQFGTAMDHFFYKTSNGKLRELRETGWGKGGMIWGESSGSTESPNRPSDQTEQLFVGTEQQYNRMQTLPQLHEGIVPGDLREELR